LTISCLTSGRFIILRVDKNHLLQMLRPSDFIVGVGGEEVRLHGDED